MRCVLTQIRINKVHEVLTQITRDKFFLWKDKDKNLASASTNHNKQKKGELAQITRKGACGQFEWPINLCNLCNEHDVISLN